MSTRPTKDRLQSLDEIIEVLGDPDRTGRDQTWVASGYSVKDLILDLREVRTAHNSQNQ